jgi:hypothetical protein
VGMGVMQRHGQSRARGRTSYHTGAD